MTISRRTMLATSAAAAAGIVLPTGFARAAAPKMGKQAPGFFRWNVGEFEVTSLHDGVVAAKVEAGRIPNASFDDVKKLLAANFMSTETMHNHFTTTLVNTGSKLVLIDSGFNNNGAPTTGRLAENMAAAGVDPKSVDIVLISHFHPDHINGLRAKDGGAVYPNAEIMIPSKEWAFWMDDARMNALPETARGAYMVARRVFNPIAKDLKPFEWGKEVAPGITAIQSDGHTIGHTSFVVSSGAKSLLVVGDASNDPRVFARNPEWHLNFDADKPLAVATRKKLLDMAAAEKMQCTFYHAAFPATGWVVKDGAGFNWVPASFTSVL